MKCISISTKGIIKITDINEDYLYNKYELGAPTTDKRYPLSVAVRCFDEIRKNKDDIYNIRANQIFKRNDFYGKIYIILDEFDDYSDDDSDSDENDNLNKSYWTFENLLNDIYNDKLVY